MGRFSFLIKRQLHKSDFGTEMLKCSGKLFPEMQPVQFVQLTGKSCRVIFPQPFPDAFASELQHNSLNVMLSNNQEKPKLISLKHDGHTSSQRNALAPAVKSKFCHGDIVVVSATGNRSFIALSVH